MKYLGIKLATGSREKEHVDDISSNARTLFNRLARLARDNWEIGYRSLLTIYKGLLVSIMTYAAAAWYELANSHDRKKIVMGQRYALMRITGAYRTTSVQALTIITGQVPVNLECERRIGLYNIRKGIEFQIDQETRYEERTRQGCPQIFADNLAKHRLRKAIMNKWERRWGDQENSLKVKRYLPTVTYRMKRP